MSSAYRVVAGDTFDSVSRKVFGTEVHAGLIARANPGVSGVLTPGTSLAVPNLTDAPQDATQGAPAANDSEVAISLNSQRFRFWTSVRIIRAIDALDRVEFVAPFDAEDAVFRETFTPFSFKDMSITVGGEFLFSGTMVAVTPIIQETKTLSASGYSKPGVLNDCTAPASMAENLEFLGQDLEGIARALCEPFGVNVVFEADGGAAFEQVAIAPARKVLDFLVDLAKQRNLIVSNNPRGDLVFLKAILSGVPVAKFEQGRAPLISVSPAFNAQEYYSDITGIEAVTIGAFGSQYTVKNPRVAGLVRPLTFTAPDTEGGDLTAAVESKMSRMFGNMAAYSIQVPTWFDENGDLWEPNTLVRLKAPDAMIYEEYDFLIRSLELNKNATSETATLDLVIPGSFSGVLPEVLPWEL